jgi:hypothetical protein
VSLFGIYDKVLGMTERHGEAESRTRDTMNTRYVVLLAFAR